ncbi:MAG: UMP kinase [Clostridia bacterium]|nr:UMP kinase [Clostridia bacterium]
MKYNRVLIKVSGEAYGSDDSIFDAQNALAVAKQIKNIADLGIKVGVVSGGGNIIRGRQTKELTRQRADYMGMLATAINSILLSERLSTMGCKSVVLSPLKIDDVADYCSSENIEKAFQDNQVVVFACGTGKPFVSTDTGAAMRASDMKADVILCAKNIDGVYDSDPKTNPDAKKLDSLTYDEVIERDLKALDQEAIELCKKDGIKIYVFGAFDDNSIYQAATGEKIDGTIIC